jgi:hypothetical protein
MSDKKEKIKDKYKKLDANKTAAQGRKPKRR